MAIELQVSSVTALVTSEPRERQIYDGRGDNRTIKGRFTDVEGRPVSTVNAVVVAEPVGLLPDAQVQLPDIQAKGLVPGAVVRVEGLPLAADIWRGLKQLWASWPGAPPGLPSPALGAPMRAGPDTSTCSDSAVTSRPNPTATPPPSAGCDRPRATTPAATTDRPASRQKSTKTRSKTKTPR